MADDVKLKDFKGFDFKIEMKPPIDEYANKCLNIVKALSPVGHSIKKKYKDGWVVETKEARNGDYIATIWNKTDYHLTHLLENGHIIVNKRNGVGWASAKPHIEEAYQDVKQPFIEAMKNVNIK